MKYTNDPMNNNNNGHRRSTTTTTNNKNNNTIIQIEEDDGGTAKNDDRRLRRERRRWSQLMLTFLFGIFVLLIVMRSKEHRDYRTERRRNRAEALREVMMMMSNKKHVNYEDGMGEEMMEEDYGSKYRWIDPRQLPPLPGASENLINKIMKEAHEKRDEERENMDGRQRRKQHQEGFRVRRKDEAPMQWEFEAKKQEKEGQSSQPFLDYTQHRYEYPALSLSGPHNNPDEHDFELLYPRMEPLGDLMKRWPQDELDHPPDPIVERLQHFDFQKEEEMKAALLFREAELPFKVVNVPEVDAATVKWTDEYVASHFDSNRHHPIPKSKGHAQESVDNFFAFFTSHHWDIELMGPPPTMDNDWSFAKWAQHARYADRVRLPPNAPHYYWQSGVPREERNRSKSYWSFVSLDLPSFSSPQETFFGFNPPEQKGIQCRFGERGVTAATHYDAGRNMVAMISGAKRYILSPPNACKNLGIVTKKKHPTFRHSLLNFGHINLLDSNDPQAQNMPSDERAWLEIARDSMAVETVLKAGEVLYIPSHWFHYITSLQKSAQCNTRSGREVLGTPEFGGMSDVNECIGLDD